MKLQMKSIIVMLSLAFPLVLVATGPSADEMALYRARRYGAEAKECLRVIDQDGCPVAGARVWGGLQTGGNLNDFTAIFAYFHNLSAVALAETDSTIAYSAEDATPILPVIPQPAQVFSCLVEAEAFADKGGWVVDPQFVEQMGSPYLLAHGKGIPVADAKTQVNLPAGRVRAFVRTRDWTPDWNGEKPGRFQLILGGKTFPVTLGGTPAKWGWVDAGVVEVGKGPQTLALHDLTGFEGRCDAIYLCPENTAMPPNDAAALREWRAGMRGETGAPDDVVKADFVVVGVSSLGTKGKTIGTTWRT